MEYAFAAVLVLYAVGLLYLAGNGLIKRYFREKRGHWRSLLESGGDPPPEYELNNEEEKEKTQEHE